MESGLLISRAPHKAGYRIVVSGLEGWEVREQARPWWQRWLRYTDLDSRLPISFVLDTGQGEFHLRVGWRYRWARAHWQGPMGQGTLRQRHWSSSDVIIQAEGARPLHLVARQLGLRWELGAVGEQSMGELKLRFAGARAVLAEGRRYSWTCPADFQVQMLMACLFIDRMRHS